MKDYAKYLLLIFGIFLLLLNYPFSSIFDKPILLLNIPLFVWYLFGFWGLMIASLFWVIEKKSGHNQ